MPTAAATGLRERARQLLAQDPALPPPSQSKTAPTQAADETPGIDRRLTRPVLPGLSSTRDFSRGRARQKSLFVCVTQTEVHITQTEAHATGNLSAGDAYYQQVASPVRRQ